MNQKSCLRFFYQQEILPGICVLEARGKEQAMPVEEVQTDQAM